jgi:hypothetical protein
VILASATPNYNDAERVYCIQSILDPASVHGGFLAFVYQHCTTEQNPFGEMPIVTGFHMFRSAADYLSALPEVDYLPDELQYGILDMDVTTYVATALLRYGYDSRKHKMIASSMEARHTERFQRLVEPDGHLTVSYTRQVRYYVDNATPLLIFANHATIAEATYKTAKSFANCGLVTGKTTTAKKEEIIQSFRNGEITTLIGTAALATGTDGLDRVCNNLLILDDTDDDALRRQLVGRIMPRGGRGLVSDKKVVRLNPA